MRSVLFAVGGIVDGQGCGGGFECAMSGSYRFSVTVCVLGGCGGTFLWSRVCVAGRCVQVLIEKRQYLPRCSGCNPEEPARSLVHGM